MEAIQVQENIINQELIENQSENIDNNQQIENQPDNIDNNQDFEDVVTHPVEYDEVNNLADNIKTLELQNNNNERVKILLDSYINGYIDQFNTVLQQADSVPSLVQWTELIFTGQYLNDIKDLLATINNVDEARSFILDYIRQLLPTENIISPWQLASTRNDINQSFFGPATEQLPIFVTVGPNIYNHLLTQDFCFGILLAISDQQQLILSINNTPIVLNDLLPLYNTEKQSKYSCDSSVGPIFFDSIDFITGLITGAQWIDVDAHKFIANLRSFENGQDGIHLNF